MLKIVQRQAAAEGINADDRLSLPFELRRKGRFRARTEGGVEVGVFIERGQLLADGDLLLTECGQRIRVCSQREAVVTARSANPLAFARACYHLGNRHVPLQIGEGWLRFQPDHVLEELVRLHGLEAQPEQAPFDPENGAYGHLGGHRHSDDHDHRHDHDHGHDHSHSHAPKAGALAGQGR
ncbi:urease accessory protein UreE [Aestuariirhabdus litorea]|uniref:Urease accessory protein UreE n=1 Tax=Aestuariirhabdus litorea TaxID=2528527 RepID=A0A3P3VNN0_9GAMM|nr:urease accessory protein UreE [Aestuariirhabdus litorea]RRJ84372.1 urease accessory protein UreE [Aestuariirhabdus litorea]RWW97596.1 urease accessory protein UreE [Endozoicomonadaceae bacterium GTF-13]